MTEQFKLGIHPPIRESGDIADTPGCILESPTGKVQIDGQVMVNGLDLSAISSRMDAEAMRNLAGGIDISMFMSSMWPMVVLGFVALRYV